MLSTVFTTISAFFVPDTSKQLNPKLWMWASFPYPHPGGLPKNLIRAIIFVVRDFMHVFFCLRRQTHCLLLGPVPELSSDILCTRASKKTTICLKTESFCIYCLAVPSPSQGWWQRSFSGQSKMWPRGWSNACISRTLKNLSRQALPRGVKNFLITSHFHVSVFKALV